MPFMHKPTFSANTFNLLLLAIIVLLGSSTVHRLASQNATTEYADFADLLGRHIRWEIFTYLATKHPCEALGTASTTSARTLREDVQFS